MKTKSHMLSYINLKIIFILIIRKPHIFFNRYSKEDNVQDKNHTIQLIKRINYKYSIENY